jgi:hypothetical protein
MKCLQLLVLVGSSTWVYPGHLRLQHPAHISCSNRGWCKQTLCAARRAALASMGQTRSRYGAMYS